MLDSVWTPGSQILIFDIVVFWRSAVVIGRSIALVMATIGIVAVVRRLIVIVVAMALLLVMVLLGLWVEVVVGSYSTRVRLLVLHGVRVVGSVLIIAVMVQSVASVVLLTDCLWVFLLVVIGRVLGCNMILAPIMSMA